MEQLVWRDRSGERLEVIGQPQERIVAPNLSPDGARVAVWGVESENPDIWIHDAIRSHKRRLTFHPAREDRPIWSPDGSQVAFASDRSGNVDMFVKLADGSAEPEELLATADSEYVLDWSQDGKYLACVVLKPGRQGDIWYLERKEGETGYRAIPLLETEFDELAPSFSPDGQLLAYASNESGPYEVYVQRFPEGGGRWQVSTQGGVQPRWRADGKELFYVEGNTLVAVPVTTSPSFSVGTAKRLFEDKIAFAGRGHRYDVSADGQRFVLVETLEAPTTAIYVVQNWFAEFRGRQSTGRE